MTTGNEKKRARIRVRLTPDTDPNDYSDGLYGPDVDCGAISTSRHGDYNLAVLDLAESDVAFVEEQLDADDNVIEYY